MNVGSLDAFLGIEFRAKGEVFELSTLGQRFVARLGCMEVFMSFVSAFAGLSMVMAIGLCVTISKTQEARKAPREVRHLSLPPPVRLGAEKRKLVMVLEERFDKAQSEEDRGEIREQIHRVFSEKRRERDQLKGS